MDALLHNLALGFGVAFTIQPDGSVTGRTQVSVTGLYAVTARSRMRHMKKETEETLVPDYYKRWGLIGSGAFEKDDPQALASWALNWNNVLDVQTTMVLDDEEARAVGKKKLEELANAKPAAISN